MSAPAANIFVTGGVGFIGEHGRGRAIATRFPRPSAGCCFSEHYDLDCMSIDHLQDLTPSWFCWSMVSRWCSWTTLTIAFRRPSIEWWSLRETRRPT